MDGYTKVEMQGTKCDTTYKCESAKSTYDCGWLSWRPGLLNTFKTSRWLLLILCWVGFSSNISINGLTNVSITSLERRFELSSSQTALIPVMYEISSSILIVIIGYFYAHGNKPRWIASGGIVVSIGCVIYILPHFLTDTYLYHSKGANDTMNIDVCPDVNNATLCTDTSSTSGESISALSKYLYLFLFGQLLLGIGAAPTKALGTVILDDSVKAKNIGVYLGISEAVNILAVAVGFIGGGILLDVLHTDYMFIDADRLGLSSADHQWVGAWWLGFIICACGVFLASVLLSLFPSKMPGFDDYFKERRGQEQNVAGLEKTYEFDFGVTFRDIPAATLILFRNPLYLCLILSNISDTSFLAGAEVFLPKFVELQYGLSAGDASITVGVILTVFGCGAMLIGGWFIKKFDLKIGGMLKVCLGCNIAGAFLLFGIFFRCPEISFAGINVPYHSIRTDDTLDLMRPCNSHCNCSLERFSPVCDSDKVTYFNPCLAGCQEYKQEMNQYQNCSCISATNQTLKPSPSLLGNTAVPGTCSETCVEFYAFAVFLSAIVFSYLLTAIPRLSVMLRCVPHRLRAFATALNSLVVRLLGSLPGAIIIGTLIDKACILWNEECGVRGRCYHYDRTQVALYIILYGVAMKVVAIFCFIASLVTYKPQREAPRE